MRIAYFLTSYQSPDAVLRLDRTLRRGDPDCHIVLHHDVHRTPLDQDAVREAGRLPMLRPAISEIGVDSRK